MVCYVWIYPQTHFAFQTSTLSEHKFPIKVGRFEWPQFLLLCVYGQAYRNQMITLAKKAYISNCQLIQTESPVFKTLFLYLNKFVSLSCIFLFITLMHFVGNLIASALVNHLIEAIYDYTLTIVCSIHFFSV